MFIIRHDTYRAQNTSVLAQNRYALFEKGYALAATWGRLKYICNERVGTSGLRSVKRGIRERDSSFQSCRQSIYCCVYRWTTDEKIPLSIAATNAQYPVCTVRSSVLQPTRHSTPYLPACSSFSDQKLKFRDEMRNIQFKHATVWGSPAR